MKIKLQPASGSELPAFSPLLPPTVVSQVLLLANPHQVCVVTKSAGGALGMSQAMGGSSVELMNNYKTNDWCEESSVTETVGQAWIAKHALAQVSQSLLIYLMKIQILFCVDLPHG